jgi:hypothetical protein
LKTFSSTYATEVLASLMNLSKNWNVVTFAGSSRLTEMKWTVTSTRWVPNEASVAACGSACRMCQLCL